MTLPDADAWVFQDLVQVRGEAVFGTGILVGTGVVLTALHCVADPADGWRIRAGRLGVNLLRDFDARSMTGPPSRSYAAHVLWHPSTEGGDPPDVVLLQLAPDAHDVLPSPVHGGPLTVASIGIGGIAAQAVGFPALLESPNAPGNRREGAFPGQANLHSLSRPVIGFTSTHIARDGGPKDWSGLSGAPLFAGGALLGVMRSVHPRLKLDRFMEAEPLERLLHDERYAELARYFVLRQEPMPPADRSGMASAAAQAALVDYLATVRHAMANGTDAYLALAAAEVPRDVPVGAAAPRRHGHVRQVRRIIRRVAGMRSGGDLADAQTAIVDRSSKVIRDIVDELLRADAPLVLLGDPGTGKSMSMREAAGRLAEAQGTHLKRLIPVFIRLGNFCPHGLPTEQDVLDSLRCALPLPLQACIGELISTRRLVVFFDGIDEMSRKHYDARVQALSNFGGIYQGRIRTIYSCRINDFTPHFVHRQIVLLPFTRAQIWEYIRKNHGPLPLTVDGRTIKPAELLDIATGEEWRHTLAIPQFLTLFVYFLRDREQLPRSRGEILHHFFRSEFDDYAASLPPGARPEPAAMFAGWAAIAYRISIGNVGAGVARQSLGKCGDSPCDWDSVIEAGLGCGLLSLVESDEDIVQFAHHRYQEYFTAQYIEGMDVEVDWSRLIDEPRWQETVNYLVAGLEPSGAILAIRISIEWPEDQMASDDDVEHARLERLVADRVEFASRVVRAHQSTRTESLSGLTSQCIRAIETLIAYGNAITHIKMLRALANLPRFSGEQETYSALLRSPLHWVRRQAVIHRTHRQSGSLGFELAADLAAHTLSISLPFYWQAIGPSHRRRDQWNLAWASMIGTAAAAALAVLWFIAAHMVAKTAIFVLSSRDIAVQSSVVFAIVHALSGCTLAAACGFFHWQRHVSLARIAWLGIMAFIMVDMALFSLGRLGGTWAAPESLSVVQLLGGLMIAGLYCVGLYLLGEVAAMLWDAAALLLYGAGASGVKVADHGFADLLKVQFRREVLMFIGAIAGVILLGALWIYATETMPGGQMILQVVGWLARLLGALIVMGTVGYAIAYRREIVRIAREIGWGGWRDWLALGSFLGMAGVLASAGHLLFFTRVFHDVHIGQHASAVFWSLALLVVAVVVTAVGVMLRSGYQMVRQRFARTPFASLAAWQEALRKLEDDPHAQASMLRASTVTALKLPTRGLWEALVAVEKSIDREPALSAYWLRRYELEQILRQQARETHD